MARIRTIKPDFFRHETLQRLEEENPDLHPMLLFSGLWGHCDKNGVFLWRPRQLALDILPFLWDGKSGEALGNALELLRENDLIKQFEVEGRQYGYVPTFRDHQNISGKERSDPSKYPEPPEIIQGTKRGSDGEVQGTLLGSDGEVSGNAGREGKGREKEGKGLGKNIRFEIPPPLKAVQAYCKERGKGVDPQAFIDHYDARGWKYNGNIKMVDWQAAVRTWEKNQTPCKGDEVEHACHRPAPDPMAPR